MLETSVPPFWHEAAQVEQVLPLHCAAALQRQLQLASNSPPFWHEAWPLHVVGSSTSGYDMRSSKPTLFVPIAILPYPLSPHDVPHEFARSQ